MCLVVECTWRRRLRCMGAFGSPVPTQLLLSTDQCQLGPGTQVCWSDEPYVQNWRLVSDDRPHSQGNRHRYIDEQDWRSVPDTTDAHNQQYSKSQATGPLYDSNFAGQDVGQGFVYPRERDEPPWRDMWYAPSSDRQHRPRVVGRPVPSDKASRVMHGSDTEVGDAKMSGDAFVTYDVMVSCLKSLLQEAFVNNQQSPVMPKHGSDSSDRVLKGSQSCQSQKCEESTRRPIVENQRQMIPKTPVLATQVLGRTPDVSASIQAACTDRSPMTPRCESAEQSTLLTPGFVSSFGPASNRPKKVAKFDGKSNWGDYLVQFNIAAKLNNWDDTQKAMELATSLEGNARGVLADLSANKQLDFEALTNKLTQRYEPEGQLGVYQSQLHSRRRKRNGSVPELVQDISRFVRKAYPAADEQTGSYMAVSSFITALGNEAQELFVYQKEPKNLDEASRADLSFETFRAARMKMSRLSVHSRWMTRQMLLPNGLETGCPGWRGNSVTGLKRLAKHREGPVGVETSVHHWVNLVHRLGTQVQNLQMVHHQAIRAQRILPVTGVEQQVTGPATAHIHAEALLPRRFQ